MLDLCSVSEAQMPELFESIACIGTLKRGVASELGLPEDIKVIAGCGDNAAAAVGLGVVGDGKCNISMGTSGTVFISTEKFRADPNNSLHTFAHADGGYHLMGCMLSAASCNKWLLESILKTNDYLGEQNQISEEMLGVNRVFFLPYLMGERSPINDTNARGVFIGMTLNTSRSDLILSVLEGVAFAIRDSVEVARSMGIGMNASGICGGGAKSKLWKRILANVLNARLECMATEQGPSMGAAMLAMVACGEYQDVKSACKELVAVSSMVMPEPELTSKYEESYQKFRKIYPAVKNIFPDLK